ncbi:MAG: hypothetical protein GY862_28200 [Gammaproteobacteria bacterium]|nr:hypothetical protein [Gammaproteobacteria bacterium]
MGKASRDKGARVEREMVHAHKDAGVHSERYDARRGQFGATRSYDIDVYKAGRDAPLCGEIKARKNGEGFVTLETWLGENDFLLLKRNNKQPMVTVPWRVWIELLGGIN